MKFFIISLALFISGASFAIEKIEFHDGPSSNTYIVELISSRHMGEREGLEIIASAAMKKCGDKPAHFGKYRFQGQKNLSDISEDKSFRMIQQLFCGELTVVAQQKTKPLSENEKGKLEAQAKRLTDIYLNHLAKYDFEKAYHLLSTTLKKDKTFKEWEMTKESLTEPLGDLLRAENWGVTTYVDPPSSPRRGVYIAVDFDREYALSPVFCGYLVWYLEGEELKVTREDIGRIGLDQFNKINAEEIAVIKSKFRCNPLTDQKQSTR